MLQCTEWKNRGRHESDGPYLMLLSGVAANSTRLIKNFSRSSHGSYHSQNSLQKRFFAWLPLSPVVLPPEFHGVDCGNKEANRAR